MTVRLDHTIVPAKDKIASARFFAEIFGLTVKPGQGYFAQVHYAFHVSEAEFEAIFTRVKAKGIPYGSGPHSHTDGQINARRGGRGFYFEDPYGHLLEVMTVPETGNEAELLENPSRV